MALVAYDYSDESETENDEVVEPQIVVPQFEKSNDESTDTYKMESSDEEDEITPAPKSFLPAPSNPLPENNDQGNQNGGITSLLTNLPPPKNRNVKFANLSLKSQVLKSTSFQPKKEDEDIIKKIKPSGDGYGGLLSLLPIPKNEITQKISKPLLPYNFLKAKPMGAKKDEKKSKNNDDDEETDLGTDFFSLNKHDTEDLPEPIEIDLPEPSVSKYLKDDTPEENVSSNDPDSSDYMVPAKPEHFNITYQDTTPKNPLNLDDETMQRFFGRKRKGESLDDVRVIDVHQDEMLAESKRLLTKQLTEEEVRPARKMGGFSSTSRRKHQITYLAFQAKEREIELKNMWAQNRLTKKQTQMKYGF